MNTKDFGEVCPLHDPPYVIGSASIVGENFQTECIQLGFGQLGR
jgi:hypothetical protein